MARANTIQTNFTSGEVSPQMYGRVDVSKYFNGARKLQNVIPLPQGGVRRRPPTTYRGAVADSTKAHVLRPFTLSNNDAYVLEFGHLTLRIWQSGALMGAPTVVTTPYASTDLASLRFAQSADTMFIAHPSYPPQVLTRTSGTSWAITPYVNEDGPYLAVTPDATFTLSEELDRATATSISSIFSTTGAAVNITAVTATSSTDFAIEVTTSGVHGIAAGETVLIRSVVGVPECLGAWVVSTPTTSKLKLLCSRKNPLTTYVSGGTAIKFSGATVEYREDNVYKLARVIDFASGTSATVDVIDAILRPAETTKVTRDGIVSGDLTTTVPTFSWTDTYKFIRPTHDSGSTPLSKWSMITAFQDSQRVSATQETCLNFGDQTKQVTVSSRTITAKLTSSVSYFAATDVNRHIRLKYGAQWLRGTISAYTSATVVTVTLQDEIPLDSGAVYKLYNDGRTDVWRIGAWNSVAGYPSVVSFHQNRLCWMSSTAEPTASWFTKSGDYYSFEQSDPDDSIVTDENALNVTLISREINRARWMDSGPVLLIGTEGAEWQVKPSSIQQTITPTNVSATTQTVYGSANLDAYRIGAQTLFIDRTKLKVRELVYDFSVDAFTCHDISILSEHILRENSGLVDWTIQRSPYCIAWLVLGNGKVASITYEKEHEVIAWAYHDLGGTVESVCAAPSASGEDTVYFVVNRTINGATVRYVETLTGLFSTSHAYLDCQKTTPYSAAITASYTAAHLPAATVGVVVDGVYIGDKTANGSGVINVTYSGYTLTVNQITVGFRTTAIIGVLDPEGGSQAGTSQGKKKRITEVNARVNYSWYFKTAVGTQTTNDTENLAASIDPTSNDYLRIVPAHSVLAASPPTNPTVNPLTPVTGDISFSLDDSYDGGARFQLVQDEPYPFHVVALMPKLNTNE